MDLDKLKAGVPEELLKIIDGLTFNIEQYEQLYDYHRAKEQIDADAPFIFGAKINVLLITDRLPGCAIGLREYLQNSTGVTVDLVYTLADAEAIINAKPLDFCVIVGYLENKENYKAVKLFRKFNRATDVFMYAGASMHISYECAKYEIRDTYDRYFPIQGLVLIMQNNFEVRISVIRERLGPDMTREQMWREVKEKHGRAVEVMEQTPEAQRSRSWPVWIGRLWKGGKTK